MKLTPWFPGAVKPVRKGVYQQRCGFDEDIGYQYWDGKKWGGWESTPNHAYEARKFKVSESHQNDNWRGVAK